MSWRTAIALAAALLVTGGALASPSLLVPGAALALLAAGAFGWALLAARGARVERAGGPPSVIEGDPYPVRVRVRSGLVSPRGELVDPLLAAPVPVGVLGGRLRLGLARGRGSVRERTRFERFGRHRLAPPRLTVRDPLGLVSRSVSGRGEDQVLVLPRIESIELEHARSGEGGAALAGLGDGAGSGRASSLGADLDGLRSYRKGTPASRIHWPAVARHGELLERKMSAGGEGTAVVALDAEHPADRESFERAVRAAASLCAHLARAGGCVLLTPGTRRALPVDRQLRGWSQAHARLALTEPGRALRGLAQATTGGPLIWVTAATAAGATPLAGAGARPTFIVTANPPAGARPAFTVAGCAGLATAGAGARRRPAGRVA